MEIVLLILGAMLICIGLLGVFIPFLPGLPFSYGGILVLQLVSQPFSVKFLVIWAVVIAIATIVDSLVPTYGSKKYGGTPFGITGSLIGLFIGMFFFPPIGFVLGPILGAFIGELVGGRSSNNAARAAFGAFMGFMVVTGIKVMLAGTLAYYYFVHMST
jgi:uncharacterized protein YqgC (DUF456 family)